MTAPLAGRTAVVTGASRGIGLAIARRLVGDGARVAMLARGAADVAARAAELGERALPFPCDVADGGAVERTVAAFGDCFGGPPDILVNNAGLFEVASVELMDPAAFSRALDVNLVAPFRFIHAVVGAMRARGSGHLVTIGSIADRVTYPGNGAYAAGKFGLRALHQVLREELRGSGIRATLVSPGPVDTALWDAVDVAGSFAFTPRDRMLSADAVADAVRWVVELPAEVNVDELRLSRA